VVSFVRSVVIGALGGLVLAGRVPSTVTGEKSEWKRDSYSSVNK